MKIEQEITYDSTKSEIWFAYIDLKARELQWQAFRTLALKTLDSNEDKEAYDAAISLSPPNL